MTNKTCGGDFITPPTPLSLPPGDNPTVCRVDFVIYLAKKEYGGDTNIAEKVLRQTELDLLSEGLSRCGNLYAVPKEVSNGKE